MNPTEKAAATVQIALANLNALVQPLLEKGPLGERHEAYLLLIEEELQTVSVGMLEKRPGDRINRIACAFRDSDGSGIGVVISPITETGGVAFSCSRCESEEPCQHVLGAIISWHMRIGS
jgi:hypothetical protein